MAATLQVWALPRLQQLLPLDDDSLKQVITYTDTLPKEQAAEHLKDILGDSPQALEFISSFNQRRQRPPNEQPQAPASSSEVPRSQKKQPKKKPNIHELPARQIESQGNPSDGAYRKHDQQDYMPKQGRPKPTARVADTLALRVDKPDATQLPLITDGVSSSKSQSKLPPSAGGQLVSDALAPKKTASRHASPAPKTKVSIAGGTAMHGASTALSDLDSAIRSLELQTNPSLAGDADDAKRQCNCMATRHPLLDIAPNCMNCGKVICVKQGLGPCTFCKHPILSSDDIAKVLRVLKDERGEERMRVNNASHKKAEVVSGKTRAFTGREFLAQASSARSSPLSSAQASDAEEDEASSKAKAHRDKLLNFQANNARRTQIHDEAADYDLPSAGTNMWASPQERAQQLKKQQRVMREMEWNARPEYEKRQVVASIDIRSGKIVRHMADVAKPDFAAQDAEEDDDTTFVPPNPDSTGAFSNNPLLGALIRPVARVERGKDAQRASKSTWRRVQMDEDDNEQWILDGGVYGNNIDSRVLAEEEHAQG